MGSSGDTELDDEDDEPWADAEVGEEGSTMSPFLVAMLWKMQRLMYVVYTLAGSSTHQAVAMVVVGLCNVVLVGAFYAALTTSFEDLPDGSTVPEAIWCAFGGARGESRQEGSVREAQTVGSSQRSPTRFSSEFR